MSDVIRLLVVDDHAIVRDGLAAMMDQHEDITVAGEAADGAEAVERFRALRPGTGTVRWASGASPPLSFPVTVEEAPPPPALPPTPATAGGP